MQEGYAEVAGRTWSQVRASGVRPMAVPAVVMSMDGGSRPHGEVLVRSRKAGVSSMRVSASDIASTGCIDLSVIGTTDATIYPRLGSGCSLYVGSASLVETARQARNERAALPSIPAPLETSGPLVSIIVPCYNTPLQYLSDAVDSVRAQSYKSWELILVDDLSDPSSGVASRIENEVSRDHTGRVVAVYRDSNGGISEAQNSGISVAKGELLCVLDHDDLLHPHAIGLLVEEFTKNRDTIVAYSDEDKIVSGCGGSEVFGEEFLKPDWSPTRLLGQMYPCHLTMFRNTRQRWDSRYDGSQDYEYLLRYLRSNEGTVRHVRHTLYHWRKHQGSTSAGMQAKPLANSRAIAAIRQHLDATGQSSCAVTSSPYSGVYWIDRTLTSSDSKSVSIIIPNKDSYDLLSPCISSLDATRYEGRVDIIVVDNGSVSEKTLAYYDELLAGKGSRFKVSVILESMPFNFSTMVNKGAAATDSELLLLLNNDTEIITPDWLKIMASHMDDPCVGAVGPMLLYPSGKIQHAGVYIGFGGVAGHTEKCKHYGDPGYFGRVHLEQEVECVTGACLLTSASLYRELGGFEEQLPEAFNDVDYCLKLRAAGRRVIYTPHSKLYHYESLSRGQDAGTPRFLEAVSFMKDKWDTTNYTDAYTRIR